MKNAFGLELYEIKEVIAEKQVKQAIASAFLPVLIYLGIPSDKSKELIENCMQEASGYSKLADYEAQAHNILDEEKVADRIPEKLRARAELIYSQIEQYLLPGAVLDYGCGDGRVAELIAKNRGQEVFLADVYEHSHVKETGLNFKLFKQGKEAPFNDNTFDNTLAITVYHHSSKPLESIKDTCRITKQNGRVIVIESVYGVNGKELPEAKRSQIQSYLTLTSEQQRKVNIFFDHFYNRVLHYSKEAETKVNVPFNFNTPGNWRKIFTQYNLTQENVFHLGLDQRTVPEYHTLHVLRKVR